MKIGAKIKDLRLKNQLTQEELACRCELSKGFISQMERDLTSPSIATLLDVLECLGTNIKDFFNEAVDEKIVFKISDVFVTENHELKQKINWLVPNSQKNRMEPILIALKTGGSTEVDDPHDGEEFGYVLSGTIHIHLGKKKYKAKKNESFYFKADVNHYLSNAGKRTASLLWISTPPNF